MITVKFIAPGILPGDYVTASVQGVPNRGDTVLVETPNADGEHDEELLTVTGVTWPVEVMPSIRHHAVAALPEVVLARTPDAWLTQHVHAGVIDPDTARSQHDAQLQTHPH